MPNTGRLIAAILSTAWRQRPSSLPEITASDLDNVAPLLRQSGAAALAWWRLRESIHAESACVSLLEQDYRHQTLQAAVHEEGIRRLFRRLTGLSVPAILAKGWAVARYYPSRGLRPHGDIDVLVAPEHFQLASEVISSPELTPFFFDLHSTFADVPERSFGDLLARSESLLVGDDAVRVLGLEDHLALLCVHFLRHGGYRPIWLCDIAAIMEALPPGFDWAVCLGKDNLRATWISCAITLAHRLLEAQGNSPPPQYIERLPGWVERTILDEWSNDYAADRRPTPLRERIRRRESLRAMARARWPNAIDATVQLRRRIDWTPRLPYQLAVWSLRAMRYVRSLVFRKTNELVH